MGPSEDQSDNQTGPVVEIELTVQNPAYPFVGVSEEEQCRVELAKRSSLVRKGNTRNSSTC